MVSEHSYTGLKARHLSVRCYVIIITIIVIVIAILGGIK